MIRTATEKDSAVLLKIPGDLSMLLHLPAVDTDGSTGEKTAIPNPLELEVRRLTLISMVT